MNLFYVRFFVCLCVSSFVSCFPYLFISSVVCFFLCFFVSMFVCVKPGVIFKNISAILSTEVCTVKTILYCIVINIIHKLSRDYWFSRNLVKDYYYIVTWSVLWFPTLLQGIRKWEGTIRSLSFEACHCSCD